MSGREPYLLVEMEQLKAQILNGIKILLSIPKIFSLQSGFLVFLIGVTVFCNTPAFLILAIYSRMLQDLTWKQASRENERNGRASKYRVWRAQYDQMDDNVY